MARLRIFLADDHTIVREGLKRLIDDEPDLTVIGEAGDGAEAVARTLQLKPEVIIMDVSMPHLNGVQATRRLREEKSPVKIIVLTVHEDRAYLRELLEAGASGYVLKRAAGDELIRAIRAVVSGSVYVDQRLIGNLVSTLLRPKNGGMHPVDKLSEREALVLRMIASGYTNKEIAARLEVSVKTVETYKARSMEKLQLRSRVDIVRIASENGWLNSKEIRA